MEPPRPRGVPWGPQLVSELQRQWGAETPPGARGRQLGAHNSSVQSSVVAAAATGRLVGKLAREFLVDIDA